MLSSLHLLLGNINFEIVAVLLDNALFHLYLDHDDLEMKIIRPAREEAIKLIFLQLGR